MYRLKSCIDFKPYEGEKTFIKFEKKGGYGSGLSVHTDIQLANLCKLPFHLDGHLKVCCSKYYCHLVVTDFR